MLDDIAPGRGGDIRPRGPQQGDIAHDDLPADGKTGGQRSGADGLGGFPQNIFDCLTAFFRAHGKTSFISNHTHGGTEGNSGCSAVFVLLS